MSYAFDLLSDRKKYASNRRSSLLSKYLKSSPKKVEWMYSFEVEIEQLLKRKLGYPEWAKNWDLGLHLKETKLYVLLSKRNELGSFQVLQKVEYSEDLDVGQWVTDSLTMYSK